GLDAIPRGPVSTPGGATVVNQLRERNLRIDLAGSSTAGYVGLARSRTAILTGIDEQLHPGQELGPDCGQTAAGLVHRGLLCAVVGLLPHGVEDQTHECPVGSGWRCKLAVRRSGSGCQKAGDQPGPLQQLQETWAA